MSSSLTASRMSFLSPYYGYHTLSFYTSITFFDIYGCHMHIVQSFLESQQFSSTSRHLCARVLRLTSRATAHANRMCPAVSRPSRIGLLNCATLNLRYCAISVLPPWNVSDQWSHIKSAYLPLYWLRGSPELGRCCCELCINILKLRKHGLRCLWWIAKEFKAKCWPGSWTVERTIVVESSTDL